MAVLPSSGDVAFFCDPGKYRTILVFRRGWYDRSIAPPCDEIESINIAGMKIGRRDYIAASCAACGTIKLMDFEKSEGSQKWVTVFQDRGEQPRKIFQGEDFTLMVFMCRNEVWGFSTPREKLTGTLWELRISDEDEFTLIKKTTLSNVDSEKAPMCYVPLPYMTCVYKTDKVNTLRAVSVYTNEVMWECCWRSQTMWCNLQSISYSTEHQKILVTNGRPREGCVFVLDPRNGSILQTITLGGIEHTKELQISGNYLVVWHHDTMATNYQVSFLSVKSTSPASPPTLPGSSTTAAAAASPVSSSSPDRPSAYYGVVPQSSTSVSAASASASRGLSSRRTAVPLVRTG